MHIKRERESWMKASEYIEHSIHFTISHYSNRIFVRHTLSLFLHLIFVVGKSQINEHQMRIMIEQIKKDEARGNEMICRCKAPIPIYLT